MKNILFLAIALVSSVAGAAVSEVDVALVGQPRNLLRNPGFEQSKSDWTASGGTLTTTTTSANKGSGNASGSWDASASTQTLTSTVQALPAGLYGKNIEASCNLQCASGTCTHTIGFWDGTTLTNATTITSSTSYTRTTITGIAGSSGNIGIRITSAANEPILYIDDCYLGEARNIGTAAQAQFIGSAYIPGTTACQPSRTNTALGAFTADTDCPGPTVELNPGPGTIQTTDADGPSFTVNNLGPGYYVVTMSAKIGAGGTSNIGLAINDGTTTSGTSGARYDTTGGDPQFPTTVTGTFSYTTTANRTFQLYGAASGGNSISLYNTNSASESIKFTITRYPLTSEQSVRNPIIYYPTYTAKISSAGTVSDEVGDFINGNCSVANTSEYTCTWNSSFFTAAPNCTATGLDTSTAAPIVKVFTQATTTSVVVKTYNNSASATAYAFNLSCQSSTPATQPAPLLVGSVTSQSTGAERIERAYIANSGSCSVTSQSGTWISSVADPGAGLCTLNFTANTWSSAPSCVVTQANNNQGVAFIATDATTSAITIGTNNTSDTASDRPFTIHCMGAR